MSITKTVSIRLDEDFIAELDKLADDFHTTKQAMLVRFLRLSSSALKKHDNWPKDGNLGLILDGVSYMEGDPSLLD